MRYFLSILLLTLPHLSFSLDAVANPYPPDILSILEDQYGGREAVAQQNAHFCLWDTKEGIGIGWLFGIGAKEMPLDVCMTGIRTLKLMAADQLPSIYTEGKFHYYKSKTPKWSSNSKDSDLLQICKTRPLKEPYDELTPELRNQFIRIFQTQGFDAGLRELNKFLDQNIAYSCSIPGA